MGRSILSALCVAALSARHVLSIPAKVVTDLNTGINTVQHLTTFSHGAVVTILPGHCNDNEVQCLDHNQYRKCVNGVWELDTCGVANNGQPYTCVQESKYLVSCEWITPVKHEKVGKVTSVKNEVKYQREHHTLVQRKRCDASTFKSTCNHNTYQYCDHGVVYEYTCPGDSYCINGLMIPQCYKMNSNRPTVYPPPNVGECTNGWITCAGQSLQQRCINNEWQNFPCNDHQWCNPNIGVCEDLHPIPAGSGKPLSITTQVATMVPKTTQKTTYTTTNLCPVNIKCLDDDTGPLYATCKDGKWTVQSCIEHAICVDLFTWEGLWIDIECADQVAAVETPSILPSISPDCKSGCVDSGVSPMIRVCQSNQPPTYNTCGEGYVCTDVNGKHQCRAKKPGSQTKSPSRPKHKSISKTSINHVAKPTSTSQSSESEASSPSNRPEKSDSPSAHSTGEHHHTDSTVTSHSSSLYHSEHEPTKSESTENSGNHTESEDSHSEDHPTQTEHSHPASIQTKPTDKSNSASESHSTHPDHSHSLTHKAETTSSTAVKCVPKCLEPFVSSKFIGCPDGKPQLQYCPDGQMCVPYGGANCANVPESIRKKYMTNSKIPSAHPASEQSTSDVKPTGKQTTSEHNSELRSKRSESSGQSAYHSDTEGAETKTHHAKSMPISQSPIKNHTKSKSTSEHSENSVHPTDSHHLTPTRKPHSSSGTHIKHESATNTDSEKSAHPIKSGHSSQHTKPTDKPHSSSEAHSEHESV
ncbi:hypothetical protein K493DRAFT_383077, partial [Basidiobolus meristosporus CBS 931.73]